MKTLLHGLIGLSVLAAHASSAEQAEVVREAYANGKPKVERTVVQEGERSVNHGPFKSWHPNGKVASKGEYESDERVGKWEFRWANGKLREKGSFADGLRDGVWRTWDDDGRLTSKGSYRAGHHEGQWTLSNGSASIEGEFEFVQGVLDSAGFLYEGHLFDGERHGEWVFRWPSGGPFICGAYGWGIPDGNWFLIHRDGTPDLEWGSGAYDRRRFELWGSARRPRSVPAWIEDELPKDTLVDAWPWSGERASQALLDSLRLGDRELPFALLDELVLLRRESLPDLIGELSQLDLDEEQDRARELHAVLNEIFAGNWEWDPQQGPTIVGRWQAAWGMFGSDDQAWSGALHPLAAHLEVDPAELPLARGGLPHFVRRAGKPGPEAKLLEETSRGKYGGRIEDRSAIPKKLDESEAWIARHQEPDGRWDADGFANRCKDEACSGPGRVGDDFLVTCLALEALISSGNLPFSGEFAPNVLRGLAWILQQWNPSTGRFEGDSGAALLEHIRGTEILTLAWSYAAERGPEVAARRALESLIPMIGEGRELASADLRTMGEGLVLLNRLGSSDMALSAETMERARDAFRAASKDLPTTNDNPWLQVSALSIRFDLLQMQATSEERPTKSDDWKSFVDDLDQLSDWSEYCAAAKVLVDRQGRASNLAPAARQLYLLRAESNGDALGSFSPEGNEPGGRIGATALALQTLRLLR